MNDAAPDSDDGAMALPEDEWLPPKFRNPDYRPPARAKSGADEEDAIVILPTADGGYQPVSSRIVHIEHQGQQIPLVVLTRAQRLRRRIVFNVIAAVVSMAILTVVFLWLTRR